MPDQMLWQAITGGGFFGLACNDRVRDAWWIHGPVA
jgi:hypothetical protein